MREDDRDRLFWERKASHYDRVAMGLFGRPLPRAVELVADGVSGAEVVLEVTAGTGLMSAVIALRVRHVMATDYAENMPAALGLAISAPTAARHIEIHRIVSVRRETERPAGDGGRPESPPRLAALLASYGPARRASRVDPTTALRHE